jgi:serine/threonine protein kinase
MDPEYVVSQELTEKSDIYSYGVLLLELVTGRRAIQDGRNLVEWAQKYMASEEMVPEMVDHTIRDWCDMDQLHMVVGVVRWCTQREGKARPSIKQVLRVFSEKLDPVYEDAEEGSFFLDVPNLTGLDLTSLRSTRITVVLKPDKKCSVLNKYHR